MTLTLLVVGLVLAPPTGWLLGAWLADLTRDPLKIELGFGHYRAAGGSGPLIHREFTVPQPAPLQIEPPAKNEQRP